MRFSFISLSVASGCALLVAACAARTPTPTQEPDIPPPSATTEGLTLPVTIENFAFSPAQLSFPKGTTVTWTNNDAAPHAIGTDGAFPESPTLNQGQSYSFTFNEAGSYPYHCTFHPNMRGNIEVTE